MPRAQLSEGTAFARAALAGNPSDGYGGAVLAVTLPRWRARAEAAALDGRALRVSPPNRLVQATLERFARELEPGAEDSRVRWETSIPQRVGLGSSSALVIAVTRALCGRHGTELSPERLAEFALAVETEELDIAAGLQDRVAQAYEGLTFMDFGTPRTYERLDPGLLPPLVIAWRETAAADSGGIHEALRRRHAGGDLPTRRAMHELATAARGARKALLKRDRRGFGDCVDATFDLRRALLSLDPACVEMVETARRHDASANYTGSGGAVVAVCRDPEHAEAVSAQLAEIGCGVALAPGSQ